MIILIVQSQSTFISCISVDKSFTCFLNSLYLNMHKFSDALNLEILYTDEINAYEI